MSKITDALTRALKNQRSRTPEELEQALENTDETLAYGIDPEHYLGPGSETTSKDPTKGAH